MSISRCYVRIAVAACATLFVAAAPATAADLSDWSCQVDVPSVSVSVGQFPASAACAHGHTDTASQTSYDADLAITSTTGNGCKTWTATGTLTVTTPDGDRVDAFTLNADTVPQAGIVNIASGPAGTFVAKGGFAALGGCFIVDSLSLHFVSQTTGTSMATNLTDTLLFDDAGDPTVGPLFTPEAVAVAATEPIGDPSLPVLAYDTPNGGPLTAEAAAGVPDDGGVTQAASTRGASVALDPVSTGGCTLYNPDTIVIYDKDRSSHYGYSGNTGAKCTAAVQKAYCYAELWKGQPNDGTFEDNNWETGRQLAPKCVAEVFHGWHTYHTYHFTKADIVMDAPASGYWGSGRGPAGWSCTGQGTNELSCKRYSVAVK
jgi:hypothetical protein